MSLQGIKLHQHIQLSVELVYTINPYINENSLFCSSLDGCGDKLIEIDWMAACVLLERARMMNICNRVCVRQCQLLQQALDIKSEGHLQNEEIRAMTER